MSGGPIISTSHLYISLSSIRPAEKPSTGFLFNSESRKRALVINKYKLQGVCCMHTLRLEKYFHSYDDLRIIEGLSNESLYSPQKNMLEALECN